MHVWAIWGQSNADIVHTRRIWSQQLSKPQLCESFLAEDKEDTPASIMTGIVSVYMPLYYLRLNTRSFKANNASMLVLLVSLSVMFCIVC